MQQDTNGLKLDLARCLEENPQPVLDAADLFQSLLDYFVGQRDIEDALKRVLDHAFRSAGLEEERTDAPASMRIREYLKAGAEPISTEEDAALLVRHNERTFRDLIALCWALFQVIGDLRDDGHREFAAKDFFYWLALVSDNGLLAKYQDSEEAVG